MGSHPLSIEYWIKRIHELENKGYILFSITKIDKNKNDEIRYAIVFIKDMTKILCDYVQKSDTDNPLMYFENPIYFDDLIVISNFISKFIDKDNFITFYEAYQEYSKLKEKKCL